MNRKAGIFWLAAVAAAVAAAPGQTFAQASGNDSAVTIWEGVYTEAQATRGQRTAQQNCGSCHSPSEWGNANFIAAWAGRSIGELHGHIRMTMPFDSPGKLTPAQYADIVAYMLKLNNIPAGSRELPSDEDGLKRISVTRERSR